MKTLSKVPHLSVLLLLLQERSASGHRVVCPSLNGSTYIHSIIGIGVGALALLLARQSAYAEGYGRPAHIWMLGVDSLHPLGLAWDNPEWDGIRSSIQIWIGFGMRHGIELTLPLAVLGPLAICVLAAVLYVSCKWFNVSTHHDH